MNNLRYFKKYIDSDEKKEITYEEALKTLLTTYRDTDITHDMLTIVNRINCRYSTVTVELIDEDDPFNHMVLMAGMYNMTPNGYEYDDDGNRLNKAQ